MLNVARWTVVMLVVGAAAAVGLKFVSRAARPTGQGQQLRVSETFQLGKNQGLHLVHVGRDRLVVACDATGIRAVTLLPNWSGFDSGMETLEDDHALEADRPPDPRGRGWPESSGRV